MWRGPLVREFGEYCETFALDDSRLSVILGLQHFQIKGSNLEIEWVGTRPIRSGTFFQNVKTEGRNARFDTIIMAAGFGLERVSAKYPTPSYWRNEQLGQPALGGDRTRYVVSGFGDGALVDLCRLTIERFRQDSIVYELFNDNLEEIEERLDEAIRKFSNELLISARDELAKRLRKDTAVTLHLSGRDNSVKSFSSIFSNTSSTLSRLLTFLLYRCGGFSMSFSDLDACVQNQSVPESKVLCRHGTDILGHLRAIIIDHADFEVRLGQMRACQAQMPRRLWKPGTFPTTNQGGQR
jgi:hypothetical protein